MIQGNTCISELIVLEKELSQAHQTCDGLYGCELVVADVELSKVGKAR